MLLSSLWRFSPKKSLVIWLNQCIISRSSPGCVKLLLSPEILYLFMTLSNFWCSPVCIGRRKGLRLFFLPASSPHCSVCGDLMWHLQWEGRWGRCVVTRLWLLTSPARHCCCRKHSHSELRLWCRWAHSVTALVMVHSSRMTFSFLLGRSASAESSKILRSGFKLHCF